MVRAGFGKRVGFFTLLMIVGGVAFWLWPIHFGLSGNDPKRATGRSLKNGGLVGVKSQPVLCNFYYESNSTPKTKLGEMEFKPGDMAAREMGFQTPRTWPPPDGTVHDITLISQLRWSTEYHNYVAELEKARYVGSIIAEIKTGETGPVIEILAMVADDQQERFRLTFPDAPPRFELTGNFHYLRGELKAQCPPTSHKRIKSSCIPNKTCSGPPKNEFWLK